jgi:hypothetical protein
VKGIYDSNTKGGMEYSIIKGEMHEEIAPCFPCRETERKI